MNTFQDEMALFANRSGREKKFIIQIILPVKTKPL